MKKKDNRVKRKRGKKFAYHGAETDAAALEKKVREEDANPFENHAKSKRAKKDAEAREGLVEEFKNRGREASFVDKRIGVKAKNMSEDEKMRLRFLKEARDRSGLARTKTKFALDDDEDEDLFLTHKGKRLEEFDDFKDEISHSDDEQAAGTYEERERARGILNEEMVNALNFGGPEDSAPGKKSREERHREIMEKSKAYKLHA